MEESRIKILGEYDWHQLKIITRAASWTIDSIDGQDEVEIVCEPHDEFETCLSLSQIELKEMIAFLQKQVKQ